MASRSKVVIVTAFVLAVMGAKEAVEIGEPEMASILEGTLIRQSQGLFTTVLKTAAGQRCLLRERKQREEGLRLRDLETGTHIRVEGRLGSFYHDAGETRTPTAAPSTWVIYMAVQTVERIDRTPPPPAEPLPDAND